MADRWAVATGNWSDTATWDGGTLPGASDDVYADGFTVTIDQDVTVASVRTTQRSGGTAGGGFTLGNTWTLTANVIAGSTSCVTFSTAGGTATIIGNCTGGGTSSAAAVRNTNTGTLTVTGTITGGTSSFTYGVEGASGGTTNVIGDCTGGTGSQSHAIRNNSSGTMNITGSIFGSANTDGAQNNSSGTINITGNVVGGSANSTMGIRCASSSTTNITGSAIGGVGPSASGATVTGTSTLRVIRAVGNEFGTGSVGISAALGVVGAQNCTAEVEEIEYGLRGQTPTAGPVSFKDLTTNVCVVYRVGTTPKTLVDPASVSGGGGVRIPNIRGGADQ